MVQTMEGLRCLPDFPGPGLLLAGIMGSDSLLNKAQQLNPAALAQIHDRFYPEIYRYVSYRLGDPQVCEDIAAEVFMRLLDALHRRRGPEENLRGWLFGVASNMVNDHLRKRYRHKEESLELRAESMESGYHLEQVYEDHWLRNEVRTALVKLTLEQQHVLALRFSEERSLDETAAILGKSVTAVKALQFRAVASLRRLLERSAEG